MDPCTSFKFISIHTNLPTEGDQADEGTILARVHGYMVLVQQHFPEQEPVP